MPVESQIPFIRAALTHWYQANARTLPWRTAPGSRARPDPYRVWLSEIMLQQTSVAAVRPYFERFTARWPTMAALAGAQPDDVLTAWAGLGYYSRARNLIACAQRVVAEHGGDLPADAAALRALPGIGDYSAAAILAIGFGQHAVPIDANIERVVARLFAIDAPLLGGKAAIRTAAQALWPTAGAGDFAQAMMDLGASICPARGPDCARCPIAEHCAGRASGQPERFPVKPMKSAKPHRHGRAYWIEKDAAVWLVRRPPRGLLGGMRALPGSDWGGAMPPAAPKHRTLGVVRHIFTHFTLDLSVDFIEDQAGIEAVTVAEGAWWPIEQLDAAGLPTLYRHAAKIAMGAK